MWKVLVQAINAVFLVFLAPIAEAQGLSQAFPLFYEKSDVHAIIFLKEHPEFESVEAMLSKKQKRYRLLFTRHDQTQLDYSNDQITVNKLAPILKNRVSHFADIQVDWHELDAKVGTSFELRLLDIQGRQVVFKAAAASIPEAKYARLIDPGTHAKDSSLALMLASRSALAAVGSSLRVGSETFSPEIKVDTPYFKAVNGYYSLDFKLGGLRASNKNNLIQPLCNAPDQFLKNTSTSRLVELKDALNPDSAIWLRLRSTNGEAHFDRFEIGFSDSQTALMSGTLTLNKLGHEQVLTFFPLSPAWAQSRAVAIKYEEMLQGQECLSVSSEVFRPKAP